MHRSIRLGVLVIGTAVAGLLPAATAQNPATLPAREAIATPQAPDEFVPAAHPTARIVLGEASFATTTGREGALECLPEYKTVQLSPGAIILKGSVIRVDFGPQEDVRAAIVGKYNAVDLALVNPAVHHGNAVGVADFEVDKEFVDGGKGIVDGSVEVKLCIPDPNLSPSSR